MKIAKVGVGLGLASAECRSPGISKLLKFLRSSGKVKKKTYVGIGFFISLTFRRPWRPTSSETIKSFDLLPIKIIETNSYRIPWATATRIAQ